MSDNFWELFENHPQFAKANDALNHAWHEAKAMPTWDAARKHMLAAQECWCEVGAMDSEPRNHIVDRLNERFPDEAADYYSDRGNGSYPE